MLNASFNCKVYLQAVESETVHDVSLTVLGSYLGKLASVRKVFSHPQRLPIRENIQDAVKVSTNNETKPNIEGKKMKSFRSRLVFVFNRPYCEHFNSVEIHI